MRLDLILKGIEILDLNGDKNIEIKDVAYDSRKVQNKTVFVAVRGYKTDGHKFIQQAIEKGAAAIIYDRDIDVGMLDNVTYIRVEDSRKALSAVAANYYDNPSKNVYTIGITGTNGKTSTTYFIEQLLGTIGKSVAVIGTNANKIGDKVYKAVNTTPESYDLQGLFKEMNTSYVPFCAMEVSSHALSLGRVNNVEYNVGIYTNLSQDHLDFHSDMDDYYMAKKKLFDLVIGYSVINIDDKYGRRLYEDLKAEGKKVLSYGIQHEADIMAKDIKLSLTGTDFTLMTPDFSKKVRMNIPGVFMIYNALGAIGGVYSMRDIIDIPQSVGALKNVKGRFDFVKNRANKNIVVDYSHSPDALVNILDNIRKLTNGKIITVFGCGGDRDRTKRPLMGKVAYDLSDYCILTNDNPRTEKPINIASDIIKGFGSDSSKYSVVLDRKAAIEAAIHMSVGEDTVLIAGKGHETYQIIGDKVFDFDDKKVALDYLKED